MVRTTRIGLRQNGDLPVIGGKRWRRDSTQVSHWLGQPHTMMASMYLCFSPPWAIMAPPQYPGHKHTPSCLGTFCQNPILLGCLLYVWMSGRLVLSCPLDNSHPASLLNPQLLLLPQQHPLSLCLSLSLFLPTSPPSKETLEPRSIRTIWSVHRLQPRYDHERVRQRARPRRQRYCWRLSWASSPPFSTTSTQQWRGRHILLRAAAIQADACSMPIVSLP